MFFWPDIRFRPKVKNRLLVIHWKEHSHFSYSLEIVLYCVFTRYIFNLHNITNHNMINGLRNFLYTGACSYYVSTLCIVKGLNLQMWKNSMYRERGITYFSFFSKRQIGNVRQIVLVPTPEKKSPWKHNCVKKTTKIKCWKIVKS